MRKLILSVDTGSDDAIAIMLAALSPELELIGCVTSAGNLPLDRTTANTLRTLDHIGRSDIPVYAGHASELAAVPAGLPVPARTPPAALHQADLPFPPEHSSARPADGVDWMLQTLRETTEPVTIVSAATLTNIAAVLEADPAVAGAIAELVIMGGADGLGNVTPSAEANIWRDPVSAARVLSAGIRRVTVVPLNATHQAAVTLSQCDQLESCATPAAIAVARIIRDRIAAFSAIAAYEGVDEAPVHDALCIGYLLEPSVVGVLECEVEVVVEITPAYGETVFRYGDSMTSPNARVALTADGTAFVDLMTRVFA